MTEATLKPGWTKVKFGEVVRLCKDRSSDPEADGIERYVGLEHLEPEDLRIRSWGLVAEGTTFTSRFKPGQVLFGKRRAYQRKVAVADFEGVCSGDIYVFESANPKYLLPELLPFICQANRFLEYAVGTSAGSLSPRTNWKSLENFEFGLPSIGEQERILSLLSAAEEVKRCAQDASESGWQARIAAYKELTHRGQNNSTLQPSEIARIPIHWEVLPIGEAVAIANKYRKPINADDRSRMQGPYPYFGPTGQLDSLNEYRLDGTYALIGEDGDHFLKYASWSMTQLISGKFNVNNHVHVIEGTDRCLTEWFFHYFRHYDIYRWLTKQGSGRLKLKKADLVEMPMAVPPIEEQKELVLVLENLDKKTAVTLKDRKLSAEAQLKNIQKRFFDG